ncbi:MAG: FAD:protein FMN transferase [Oscillospiraceae bacterium]|nr:FAD:protein FMN transferase [Oscillospiraceae bacterium]
MLRKWIFVIGLCVSMLCCGCSEQTEASCAVDKTAVTNEDENEDEKVTRDFFAMDTYICLTAYGENGEAGIIAAENCIQDLDARLSTGNASSEIAQLNANGAGRLSEDTCVILQEALHLQKETNGAFNPLMYPIMQAWGFPTQEYRIPDDSELQKLLSLIKPENMQFSLETGTVSFSVSGMELDLGGIAKGYTSDAVMDCFCSSGVTSGMVSLGGNVQTIGTKPDGSLWRVAIRHPDKEKDFLGILETKDCAVITSGGYERYFEENGVRYHHIMDPATGKPADSDLLSVTIVSQNGLLADGLSTALFVMGLDKAISYWQAHASTFDAILYATDGTLYVTAGIQDDFSANYPCEIIQEGMQS